MRQRIDGEIDIEVRPVQVVCTWQLYVVICRIEASLNHGNSLNDTKSSCSPTNSQKPCGDTLVTSTWEVRRPSVADFIRVFLNQFLSLCESLGLEPVQDSPMGAIATACVDSHGSRTSGVTRFHSPGSTAALCPRRFEIAFPEVVSRERSVVAVEAFHLFPCDAERKTRRSSSLFGFTSRQVAPRSGTSPPVSLSRIAGPPAYDCLLTI